MADDTKYKDIFSVNAIDNSTQLFSIDREFKLWTMYMTPPIPNWTEWQTFPLPGDSGGVIKITASPGSLVNQPGIGNIYYFPQLWAIDLKNDLWSRSSQILSSGMQWTKWAEWVPPYPSS